MDLLKFQFNQIKHPDILKILYHEAAVEVNEKIKVSVLNFPFSTHVTFGNFTNLSEAYFFSPRTGDPQGIPSHSLDCEFYEDTHPPSENGHFYKNLKSILSLLYLALSLYLSCACKACVDANGEQWGQLLFQ